MTIEALKLWNCCTGWSKFLTQFLAKINYSNILSIKSNFSYFILFYYLYNYRKFWTLVTLVFLYMKYGKSVSRIRIGNFCLGNDWIDWNSSVRLRFPRYEEPHDKADNHCDSNGEGRPLQNGNKLKDIHEIALDELRHLIIELEALFNP